MAEVFRRLKSPGARSKLAAVLLVVGVAAGCAAAGIYAAGKQQEPKPPVRSVELQPAPSSVKVSERTIDDYKVPATDPRYISIPAINVAKTRVLKLGLTKAGQIAAPQNIYDAGWYEGSARPGQEGAGFVYAHVSSWKADGIFYNLKKLRPGDRVYITRGDGRQFIYEVISSKIYGYQDVDMGQVLSPLEPGRPALNLMTCAGQIIKGTNDFDRRLVVFTRLADR